MKKIICMLLAASLILTSTGALTACSKKESGAPSATTPAATTPAPTTPTTEAATPSTSENNESVFPKILSDLDAYPIPDIDGINWQLVGGIQYNVEMEASDLEQFGTLQFTFFDNNVLSVFNGVNVIDGTYEVISDGYALDMLVDTDEYFGAFTEVNGVTTLIIVDSVDSEVALYLQPEAAVSSGDFPEAFSGLEIYPIPDIEVTFWQIVGGMRDGEELDLGGLAMYTTSDLTFFFDNLNIVYVSNGEADLEGTYEIVNDGYGIDILADVMEYFGVFSEVKGIPTIIIVDSQDPETLIYLQQLDER